MHETAVQLRMSRQAKSRQSSRDVNVLRDVNVPRRGRN